MVSKDEMRKLPALGYATTMNDESNALPKDIRQALTILNDHWPAAEKLLREKIESLTREKAEWELLKSNFIRTEESLRAELDAAKVNDRRYRLLRDGKSRTVWVSAYPSKGGNLCMLSGDALDTVVDNYPHPPINTARSRTTSGVDAAKLIGETGEKIG